MTTLLHQLLAEIRHIPDTEFIIGKEAKDRPVEMGLLAKVVSLEEIREIRSRRVGIVRKCERGEKISMVFQVINGKTHNIIATLVGDNNVTVTDNDEVLLITRVEDLHEHILSVTR